MDSPTGSTGATGRDAQGRFGRGNAVGRRGGNPRLKLLGEHQQALRDAVLPAELVQVVRTLLLRAQAGDTLAARLVLERYGGRPRSHVLRLPRGLTDGELLRGLAASVAEGEIPPDAAGTVAGLLRVAVELDDVQELKRRLDAFEGRGAG